MEGVPNTLSSNEREFSGSLRHFMCTAKIFVTPVQILLRYIGCVWFATKTYQANFLVIDQNLVFVLMVTKYMASQCFIANFSSNFWPNLANSWASKTITNCLANQIFGRATLGSNQTAPSSPSPLFGYSAKHL